MRVGFLLDTNAATSLKDGKSERFLARVEGEEPGSIAISAIVAHELYYGAYHSQRVLQNLRVLQYLFEDLPVLDFTTHDAHVSGEIRADLARSGNLIGGYDLLIAGQAKARGLTVVTNNLREFQRVDGLRVEDWTI